MEVEDIQVRVVEREQASAAITSGATIVGLQWLERIV
jgi:hypothetical protein